MLNNVVELFLALLAARVSFDAARRSQYFEKKFWTLSAGGFVIFSLAQVILIYYDNILHASLNVYWPSDIPFLYFLAPLAMTLFLDSRSTSRVTVPQLLDFLQIGIVTFATYLFFFYVPLKEHPGSATLAIINWQVYSIRDFVLAAAFLIRTYFTDSRHLRSLFGRMSVFLVLFSIGEYIYLRQQALYNMQTGSWYELGFSLPFAFAVVFTATWSPSPRPAGDSIADAGATRHAFLVAQIVHVVFPLLVLAMARTAAASQFAIAAVAVCASFACSGARLLLSQLETNRILTAQRAMAQSLRQAEEKYRSIFENAVEGIYQITPEGRYLSANPAMARMLGYDFSDDFLHACNYLGKQVYVDAQAQAAFRQRLEALGVVQDYETEHYRKDGSKIWVSVNARAVRDAGGKLLFYEGSTQDITERRQLEQQLLQVQKLESVGTLAGGVAHDFNNLLTVISGYGTLISDRVQHDAELAHPVGEVVKAAERAAMLTRQLLAFSRRQVQELSILNLHSVVNDLNRMLERLIGENIEIRTTTSPDLWLVRADRGQMEQIIMNLVVNARDAMPQGGRIIIETRNEDVRASSPEHRSGMEPGSYVLLSVSDNGTGMDQATLANIFQPFFTTKEPGKGTGLGLSTVYGIVKQSDGHIFATSEPGAGSNFRVYLPRAQATGITARERKPTLVQPGTETILLVEDDASVRDLACSILRGRGYTVLTARSPMEAETLVKENSQIHLLLTDMIMPGGNGRELAMRLAAMMPSLKVLYMSGYTGDALSHIEAADRSYAFLQKPFTPTSIEMKVREALDSPTTFAN